MVNALQQILADYTEANTIPGVSPGEVLLDQGPHYVITANIVDVVRMFANVVLPAGAKGVVPELYHALINSDPEDTKGYAKFWQRLRDAGFIA